MARLIRSTNLCGGTATSCASWVRTRGVPCRVSISPWVSSTKDAFISFEAFVQMLEATAEEKTMLFPIVILVLTLSPVLIPALVIAFHLVANRRRNSRELVTLVGGQITALATDG